MQKFLYWVRLHATKWNVHWFEVFNLTVTQWTPTPDNYTHTHQCSLPRASYIRHPIGLHWLYNDMSSDSYPYKVRYAPEENFSAFLMWCKQMRSWQLVKINSFLYKAISWSWVACPYCRGGIYMLAIEWKVILVNGAKTGTHFAIYIALSSPLSLSENYT